MIEWICCSCGEKYGRQPIAFLAKGHHGECGICGMAKPVTEPHNFGHLKEGWRQQALEDFAIEVVRASAIGDQHFVACLRGDDEATTRLRLAIVAVADLLRAVF